MDTNILTRDYQAHLESASAASNMSLKFGKCKVSFYTAGSLTTGEILMYHGRLLELTSIDKDNASLGYRAVAVNPFSIMFYAAKLLPMLPSPLIYLPYERDAAFNPYLFNPPISVIRQKALNKENFRVIYYGAVDGSPAIEELYTKLSEERARFEKGAYKYTAIKAMRELQLVSRLFEEHELDRVAHISKIVRDISQVDRVRPFTKEQQAVEDRRTARSPELAPDLEQKLESGSGLLAKYFKR